MTFLVLIAVAVGAVWGALLALRGSLALGCVLYLVLASCLGAWFWSFDLAGITLTLDRLFLVALAGAFVVQWRLGRAELKPPVAADWLACAFVAWITLSAFTHDWRSMKVGDVPVIQHLINGYYIPLTLYFIARNLRWDEPEVSALQKALAAFGVYLAVTGLLEAAGQWSLVFPRYIADPEIGLHFGRARGPMVHSVTYGHYLSACLVALWLWRDRCKTSARLLVGILLPIFPAAIFFTKTRTVWLGAGTAIFLILAFTLRGKARVLTLGAMVTVSLVVGAAKMDSILGFKREGTVADTRQSATMRESFTYVSWRMFQDRPILGFGFGQFPSAKLEYLGDRSVDLNLQAIRGYVHHNTFLSVLTETGIIGLALMFAILYRWARSSFGLARRETAPSWARSQGLFFLAALCIAAWQMIGHEITFTPLDMSLLFLAAGSATAIAQRQGAATRNAPGRDLFVVSSRSSAWVTPPG